MSHSFYPGLIKSGKIKVTFENETGTKKAVVLFEYNKEKDEIGVSLIHPPYEQANKDRHELYMFQALAFHGSFSK